MVADLGELRAARHLLDLELTRARNRGLVAPSRLAVGVMLEVPALLWQLPELLREIDFLSVGSNDLVQFLFAADRGNPRLAGRYDPLSPPVLRALKIVVEACKKANVELSLCGEIAGKPIEAMALLGVGLRPLSWLWRFRSVKAWCVRSTSRFTTYLDELMNGSQRSVRDSIRLFARDHGIPL